MLNTVWGTVKDGEIELLEKVDLAEGAKVLITVMDDEDQSFWLGVSQVALDAIWDNPEDDVYVRLLQE